MDCLLNLLSFFGVINYNVVGGAGGGGGCCCYSCRIFIIIITIAINIVTTINSAHDIGWLYIYTYYSLLLVITFFAITTIGTMISTIITDHRFNSYKYIYIQCLLAFITVLLGLSTVIAITIVVFTTVTIFISYDYFDYYYYIYHIFFIYYYYNMIILMILGIQNSVDGDLSHQRPRFSTGAFRSISRQLLFPRRDGLV